MNVTLNIPEKLGRFSNEELYDLCVANPDLRIERNSNFELIFMSPTGFLSSSYNSKLNFALELWNSKLSNGIVTDSNGGFLLENGAMRVPDVAWISNSRLSKTSLEDREKFLPVSPEFVIELLSVSDRISEAKDKMLEWIENGVELAWLIDIQSKTTLVYSTNQLVIEVPFTEELEGGSVLKGLKLNLNELLF